MKTKRLWSTIIVSFICFLLSSSFVLQTSAETIQSVSSLQGATVVNAVIPDGYEGEQADHEYVSDLNVTEESDYFDGAFTRSSIFSGGMYPVRFNVDGCRNVQLNNLNVIFSYDDYNVTKSISSSVNQSRSFFTKDNYFYMTSSLLYINSFDSGEVSTYSFGYTMSNYDFYVSSYGTYNFVFVNGRSGYNSRVLVFDLNWNFISYSLFSNTLFLGYCSDSERVFLLTSKTISVFNMKTRSIEFENLSTGLTSSYAFYCCVWNGYIILTSQVLGKTYYLISVSSLSDTLIYEQYLFPVDWSKYSGFVTIGTDTNGIYIPTSNGDYIGFYNDKNYYYNMIDYTTSTTFTPDRYLNFMYLANSSGSNGGGYIGLNLDFGVPDYYYSQNEVTGYEFTCMVGSFSNDPDTFSGGIPPLTVDAEGDDKALPIINGKMVRQLGDLYLWAFTVTIFTSGDGPITSLDITINQYIPLQTSTHAFSLPCSALTLQRWEDTSSAIEDIKGDIVIIGNQIGETNEKLDEIQNILTSLPDDHESNMQQWSDNLQSAEEMESVINSYIDEYMSVPSMDASIEAGFSDGVGVIEDVFENQNTAYLFEFIRNMWTVHPYMLNMTSIVIVLGVLGIYIRSA